MFCCCLVRPLGRSFSAVIVVVVMFVVVVFGVVIVVVLIVVVCAVVVGAVVGIESYGILGLAKNIVNQYFTLYFPKAIQVADEMRARGKDRYIWMTQRSLCVLPTVLRLMLTCLACFVCAFVRVVCSFVRVCCRFVDVLFFCLKLALCCGLFFV